MVRVGRPETMNPKVKNVSLAELGRKQVEKDHKVPDEDERIDNERRVRKYNIRFLKYFSTPVSNIVLIPDFKIRNVFELD